jgi:hypothetical protein
MNQQELQRMNDVVSENRSLKQANEELRKALNASQREPMRLHQEDSADTAWSPKDHSTCGRGDYDGPYDSDCACRGTNRQEECRKAGCGFCRAALGAR